MDPIEGLSFGTVERHALPALSDGFKQEYKKSWMESFQRHLARYDPQKLENVLQTVMKTLAATLSRHRGIQYEFGSEFVEYSAKKAAGTPVKSHLRPLSELFSEQQLEEIPVDNKAGENYFGQMTAQLRQKGGASFKAVGERLVLSSNADIAFSGGSEKMLVDKELKKQKQKVDKIEAEWSKAQKDLIKAKVAVSDAEADIIA